MRNANETILIVDDNPRLLTAVQQVLEGEGYHVLTATDGLEALTLMQQTRPDLIIADIAMPRMNGYQLYERVSQNPNWVMIPFIFLTARGLDSDIRYGKEIGVDDYLVKPVEPDDLLAATRGKLKRARQWAAQAPALPSSRSMPLQLGALSIDPVQHRAELDHRPLELSPREYTLLEYMARRGGQLLSSQELIKATHGWELEAEEAGALLRPLIRSLRRKLGYAVGEDGCIENVRGIGYRLVPPVSSQG